ncbi:MAG: RidA family protein [Bacteroidetes bacterium]|nr:MAG: RidA family protein [Bacteroidota bacterium]TAG87664.1 MAG: RidA family protein [Bacteroidota bacterium]
MKEIVLNTNAPAPIGPYSQATLLGNLLFVSGQIALDDKGELHKEDIKIETHQVMKNLGLILQQAGFSFEDVLKCTIFLKNFNDFQLVNEVYGSYFQKNPPARETVEVSRLPKDVNIEISCIAGK